MPLDMESMALGILPCKVESVQSCSDDQVEYQ